MGLAHGDHRVDQHPVIVDRGVSREAHLASVAVDLDLDELAPLGKVINPRLQA
jgi:hypothetical protein